MIGKLAKYGVVLLIAGFVTACSTFAVEPPETEATGVVETHQSGGILQQSIIVPAPIETVWAAFTTDDGYEAWAAPFAHIDLRVGGLMETSYMPGAEIGDPDNIRIGIEAYIPERLLVLKTISAPADVASPEMLDRLVSIFEFEPVGEDATRIMVSGVGYGEDEDSLRLRDFFIEGNAWSLRQLHASLTAGPFDWTQLAMTGSSN